MLVSGTDLALRTLSQPLSLSYCAKNTVIPGEVLYANTVDKCSKGCLVGEIFAALAFQLGGGDDEGG